VETLGGERSDYRPRRPELTALHQAVREGWPKVAEAARLPPRVHEEVRRYLGCGDVRRGFTVVRCDDCAESSLIAFSCKARGWCPSCGARRAHEAALHLGEVLPRVAFRQWTLSVPFALRFLLVKEPKLLRKVERRLVEAIFRWQRQRAKELGASGKRAGGAVCFTQLFGSALQLQPHLHGLVAEGVWNDGVFMALPAPSPEDVEDVLERALAQLLPDFESRGVAWPEDEYEALQAKSAQLRLPLDDEAAPARKGRLAVMMGFSLHADTATAANDREGLLRLCRYGARGPVAESRLSRREDGRYAYETKKGVTLVLTAEQLVKRLIALIVPKGLHLTNFHGVFAPAAVTRSTVAPPRPVPSSSRPAPAEQNKSKRPRIDWATLLHRTFACDVWKCPCGGQRRVVALVTNLRTAEEMLRNMGRLHPRPPLPEARGPPQRELLPDA
jgi:hypothetical protein